MITRFAAALAAATLIATPALAAGTAASPAGTGDSAAAGTAMVDTETFVVNVPSSNAFEIESSKLALQKGSVAAVKTFAQHMIDDHTKAGTEFKAAVQEAGITVPGDSLNERHQAMLETLSGSEGASFDAAYMQAQLQAHREAVQTFSAYAQSGDSAPLKTFAEKTLPTLKDHLAMVEEMSGGVTGSTGSDPMSGTTGNSAQ